MEELRPKVGIGVLIFKDGKLLLAKRKSATSHGYAGPGGHLEFGESFEECVKRETKEEAGIEIKNIRLLDISNILIWKGKHYVDLCMVADWDSGDPINLEPEVREEWQWFDLENLPQPLFEPMERHFEAFRTGKFYFGTIR